MNRFDALRAEHPDLGFALYALDPAGVVTLEIMTETGDVFTFTGATSDECLAAAFPVADENVLD